MSQVSEVTITIKGESDSYKYKELCYEDLINFHLLDNFVRTAKSMYTGNPQSIIAKITLEV